MEKDKKMAVEGKNGPISKKESQEAHNTKKGYDCYNYCYVVLIIFLIHSKGPRREFSLFSSQGFNLYKETGLFIEQFESILQ